MVSDFVFKIITDLFGTPEIDLFATRLNHKLPIYVSWKPDPYSVSINAFSVSWSQSYMHCFLPFSVIWKVLKKIRDNTAEAIVITPHWPTQSWFPAALQMCIAQPLVFGSRTSAAARNSQETSSFSQNGAAGSSCIRQYIEDQPIPPKAKEIILASWQNSTQDRYASVLKKWEPFCDQRCVDLLSPSITDIITFLTNMFEKCLGYSSICTACSALNNFVSLPGYSDISEHNLIKRFIKGCFSNRPLQPDMLIPEI